MSSHPDQDESHHLSEKEINTDNAKSATAYAAITDPTFPLPVLNENSPVIHYVRSFAVLVSLIIIAVAGSWYMGMAVLQSDDHPYLVLDGLVAAAFAGLAATGNLWIDWWVLVLGYWWLSLLVAVVVSTGFVLSQETQEALQDVD